MKNAEKGQVLIADGRSFGRAIIFGGRGIAAGAEEWLNSEGDRRGPRTPP